MTQPSAQKHTNYGVLTSKGESSQQLLPSKCKVRIASPSPSPSPPPLGLYSLLPFQSFSFPEVKKNTERLSVTALRTYKQ